jgi:hypothetical protein
LSLFVGVPSSRQLPSALAAVSPWTTPCRALPAGTWGRGYPKPRRPSVLAKFGVWASFLEWLRATPRRAVELYAERVSRRKFVVQGRHFRRVASLGEPPRWHVLPCCEPAFVP